MYEAEAEQVHCRTYELQEAWKGKLDGLQEWQAAAGYVPHKQLWKLHKQSAYNLDENGGINLTQIVLEAVTCPSTRQTTP